MKWDIVQIYALKNFTGKFKELACVFQEVISKFFN